VLAQDHPRDRLEVLVVDGGSTDGTGDRARAVLERADHVRWKVIENAVGTTPSNLNAGLAVAQGSVVCRVDARSLIPPHYVRTCAAVLAERPDVAVVGGAQVAVPPRPGAVGVGIARALNNPYGMGLARYRRGAASGPTDTVYLGAFRTTELRGARGWDERLTTNQDFELNRRMGQLGLVWFDDRLEVGYVPRPSLRALARQYHRFGRWKVRYWRTTADRPRARQVALLAAPPVAAVGLAVARRHPLATAVVAGAAALAVDSTSGGPAPAGVRSRCVGVAALAAVAGGWTSGVWSALASGRASDAA
jgi:glycosyltransferase involved in cell wall biosynthesis